MNYAMKKMMCLLILGAIAMSLAACSGKPSEDKIKQALEEGTITVEDAKGKGWIDDAWIEANFEQVDAGTKIHLFTSFDTSYLDGSAASSDLISGKMCLVFFDTAEDGTMENLSVFNKISGAMKEKGVPALGIVMDEDIAAAREALKDIAFPVIVYNDEMKASLDEYGELLKQGFTYAFTKEGGFYTAWATDVDEDAILEEVDGLAREE